MDIDFGNSIVYALSENGTIYGKSYLMKPYMSTVFFSFSDDKSWGLFNKKTKNSEEPVSITLSRDARWFVTSSSRLFDDATENQLKVYSISKPVKIQSEVPVVKESAPPSLVCQTELATEWKGSNMRLGFNESLEFDQLALIDMKVTINGEYIIMGLTSCTGLLQAYILRDGNLYNILKNIKIHSRKGSQSLAESVDVSTCFTCYEGIYFTAGCDMTFNKLYLK